MSAISEIDIRDMRADAMDRVGETGYVHGQVFPGPTLPVKDLDAYVRKEQIRQALDSLAAPLKKLETGQKYDQDKPRMDLLDPNFLEGVAKVLTFGAQKYAANNWRNGIAVSRLIAASYRHLGAINRGEDIDPESGLGHVYHLGCCVMFLSEMMKQPKFDDRYNGKTK